jgi:hypothetical protein
MVKIPDDKKYWLWGRITLAKHNETNEWEKHFDIGEFWSQLMNTKIPSLTERFTNPNHKFLNHSFSYRVSLNAYPLVDV